MKSNVLDFIFGESLNYISGPGLLYIPLERPFWTQNLDTFGKSGHIEGAKMALPVLGQLTPEGWAQHLSVPQCWVQWWVVFEAKSVWQGCQGVWGCKLLQRLRQSWERQGRGRRRGRGSKHFCSFQLLYQEAFYSYCHHLFRSGWWESRRAEWARWC